MSSIIFNNNSSSPDPVGSGKSQLYAKSDGKVYKQQDGGAETELASQSSIVSGISGFGSSGGTFVVPPNVTRVTVKLWGAGGTGLGSDNSTSYAGSGGGHCIANVDVTPGDSYTVTVGAGATGTSASGGNTSVTINSVEYKATGGAANGGTPGTGTNGQVNLTGKTGGAGGTFWNTRIAFGAGGVGHGGGGSYGGNGADGLAIFEW